MKGLKRILKKFDYFGIELHFLYDSKEQYYSTTGGFIFLLFSFVSITYIACNVESCLESSSLKSKSRLINKGFIKIFTRLDIFTYINKMHQLELISYLLIDSNSNRILNLLSKPVISASPYKDIFDYINIQSSKETTDKEMNDIYTYLNYINTKSHKTYMESKLLELSEIHLDSVYHQ